MLRVTIWIRLYPNPAFFHRTYKGMRRLQKSAIFQIVHNPADIRQTSPAIGVLGSTLAQTQLLFGCNAVEDR
jgi:hypothetical protein